MSSVTLTGDELDLALAEVETVRAIVQPGDYRDQLDQLQQHLTTGQPLDDTTIEVLDRLLTLALQSGRVRALYGPGGEQAALRAFRKLPTGRDLASSAGEVNEALATLHGNPLETIAITPMGPGAFTIALAANGTKLSIRLDRQGARLASVEA